jgi:imidazolonepropionase-like amidohydrolase
MMLYTAHHVLNTKPLSILENGAVLELEGNIAWVGPLAAFPWGEYPEDLQIKDLGDVTLMPGLIDAHVHLAFDGGPAPVARMMAENDARQVALMLRSARELLSVGVTTARDLGARGYLDTSVRDAIAAGEARGPRMLTAGAPLTVTGGHCWFMGAEVDTEDDVRKMVRQHHKMGVDVIKVMSTGGFMTAGSAPWFAQFIESQLRAAVDEAHRVGMRVAAHAHGIEGIQRALAAGVDTLEHCSFVHADGSKAFDEELGKAIAASGTYVSPTYNFRAMEMSKAMGITEDPAFLMLHRLGAKIIASTDSGIDNTPHHGYVGGLVGMEAAGLTPDEVILAATLTAAEALGLADTVGQLAPGFAADLIAVRGNPRESVAALHELVFVATNGVPFTPDELTPLPAFDPTELPTFVLARPKEQLARVEVEA